MPFPKGQAEHISNLRAENDRLWKLYSRALDKRKTFRRRLVRSELENSSLREELFRIKTTGRYMEDQIRKGIHQHPELAKLFVGRVEARKLKEEMEARKSPRE